MRSALPAVAAAPSASWTLPLPVLVMTFCLMWASAFSVGKMAIADCPPLLFLAVRFLAAGVLMLGPCRRERPALDVIKARRAGFRRTRRCQPAAYLGIGLSALKTVSSGLAALIISSNPILAAVLAVFLLDERMTWSKVIGLLLGLGGVIFIVKSRLTLGADQFDGICSPCSRCSPGRRHHPVQDFAPKGGFWIGNGVQSLAAGIALMPFAVSFESFGDVVPTGRLIAAFAYSVVIVSVFAYLLWFQILPVSGATAASSYHFLIPPLGMMFGWLLLGEQCRPADMIGIVPVAFGIYLVTRSAAS